MNGKTTFRFIGSLLEQAPDIAIKAQKMASGDVLAWADASIKVLRSAGDIVTFILDKRNTQLLKEESEMLSEQGETLHNECSKEYQLQIAEKLSKLRDDFKDKRNALQKANTAEKINSLQQIHSESEKLTHILNEMRGVYSQTIEICRQELDRLDKLCKEPTKELRQYDELMRVMTKQYNDSFKFQF